MRKSMDLRHRSDHELLSDVSHLVGSHRELTAKLVAHLGEIEERRLHLIAGYGSMFDFCVKGLGLSEGEAFRRILASRLGRRFPVVHAKLASGAVHLSALELLRERLTDENHAELLDAVSGKSKREVEVLLAARFPRPDVPSTIRKLPKRPDLRSNSTSTTLELERRATAEVGEQSRARIEPLSEARFKIEFTAGAELRAKVELCRDLLSHANPSRDLAVVIERAIDLLLGELESQRLARRRRPRRAGVVRGAKASRVTSAARREVFQRDGLQCTYVSPQGRRCETRAFLELDHTEPRACGGSNEPENLRVRCRAHNQLWAEQVFGREVVERSRHFCQQKRRRRRDGEQPGESQSREAEAPSSSPLEKVRLALTGMGFRDAQARKAVAEVERRHDATGLPTLEEALREAVLVATMPG